VGSVVPVEVVVLAVDPGVLVQREELADRGLQVPLPEGIRVVGLEVSGQAVAGDGRPLAVPAADPLGDLGGPGGPGHLGLPMVDLVREGPGDAQTILVGEHRAFFDQVPEEDHQVGGVVVGAAQGAVLDLDPLAVNARDFLAGHLVREGQTQELSGVHRVAGHVVQRHALAQAVPAEVADRAIAGRGLPGLCVLHPLGHTESPVQLDVGQAPQADRSLGGCLLEPLDEVFASLFDARQIAATDEDHVVGVAKGIVERADLEAPFSGVFQVEQRQVAVVELGDQPVGGAIAQGDYVALDRQRGGRGVLGDGQLCPREAHYALNDPLGKLVIAARCGHDDRRVGLAILDHDRLETERLELRDRGGAPGPGRRGQGGQQEAHETRPRNEWIGERHGLDSAGRPRHADRSPSWDRGGGCVKRAGDSVGPIPRPGQTTLTKITLSSPGA